MIRVSSCYFLLATFSLLVHCQVQPAQQVTCSGNSKEEATSVASDSLNVSLAQLPTTLASSLSSTASPKESSSKLRAENCDKTFHDKRFILSSYNYSDNYPDNIECTYIVFRNSSKVCYIELTFRHFDVEVSPNCVYDYLSVNSIRLCGTLKRETTRTYIFNTTEKIVKFHSDNRKNRSGFLIEFEQLECRGDAIIREMPEGLQGSEEYPPTYQPAPLSLPCDRSFSEPEFEIISPLYPSPYPRSTDCLYVINKSSSNVCRLEVTYHDFNLQGVNEFNYCLNDYLDFNGVRMCGEVSQHSVRNYYFPDSKFSIRFHADSFIQNRGFRLTIKQGECNMSRDDLTSSTLPTSPILTSSYSLTSMSGLPNPTTSGPTKRFQSQLCDQVFKDGFFEIISPRYPANYPQSTSCSYTVVKKTDAGLICQLEMHVLEFEMDQSNDCKDDSMNFDGQSLCGSLPSKTVKIFPFERSEFVIKFRSDSMESPAGRRAFHLQFRQKECPDGFSLTPTKMPLNTSGEADVVTSKKRLENCGLSIQSETFELKSPQYPQAYENNFDCPFTIKKLHYNICYLSLTFHDFDIDYDKDCKYDYLAVDSQLYCGLLKSGHTQMFPFANRSEISINFHSDGANSGRGFFIKGFQKECSHLDLPQSVGSASIHYNENETSSSNVLAPSICEVCFASKEGTIKSYNYPNPYPANLTCNYRIAGLHDHCGVYLRFETFELQEPQNGNCSGDYLLLDGVHYCGKQLLNVQKLMDLGASSKEVIMKFHTNSQTSGKGFLISYAQIPCADLAIVNQGPVSQQLDRQNPQIVLGSEPISVLESSDRISPNADSFRVPCDLAVLDQKFEVSSPGFPYGYSSRADCLYSIRRLNFNICKLRLEFVVFDLESSPACQGDNLEIEGEKLCGSMPANTVKEYDFTGYRIALRFRSDSYGFKTGFMIRGQQIECSSLKQSPVYLPNSSSFNTYASKHQPNYSFHKTDRYPTKPSSHDLPDYNQGSRPSSAYQSFRTNLARYLNNSIRSI